MPETQQSAVIHDSTEHFEVPNTEEKPKVAATAANLQNNAGGASSSGGISDLAGSRWLHRQRSQELDPVGGAASCGISRPVMKAAAPARRCRTRSSSEIPAPEANDAAARHRCATHAAPAPQTEGRGEQIEDGVPGRCSCARVSRTSVRELFVNTACS